LISGSPLFSPHHLHLCQYPHSKRTLVRLRDVTN
jgi:hypothetical protein